MTKLPFGGVGAVAFGGKHRNILFAVVGSVILDVNSATVKQTQQIGSSLFAITNLATGREYSHAHV